MSNLTGEWADPNGSISYIDQSESGKKFNVRMDKGGPVAFIGTPSGNRFTLSIPALKVDIFKGQIEKQNGTANKFKFDQGFAWTRYQPDPIVTAKGRLHRSEGKCEFSPITGYRQLTWADISPKQKANIKLTVKPELTVGPSGARYLHVDLDGSIVSASSSGKLASDGEFERGYYLEKVYTIISPLSSQVQLVKAADISPTESGQVTSSTSTTLSLTGSGKVGIGDKGPSGEVGGSLGFSHTVGESYTRNLLGFTPSAPRVSEDANRVTVVTNDYKLTGVRSGGSGGLKPYAKWVDITNKDNWQSFWDGFASFFDTSLWSGFKLHGLPEVAKSGLPLVSQALFVADEKFAGRVRVYVGINAIVRKVWATGATKFDAKTHTSQHEMSLQKTFEVDFGLLA